MQDDISRIHQASMKILETTGISFHHPAVVDLLKHHGIRVTGKTAFFKETEVMGWVQKAPSQFNLYARNPEYNMLIGKDEVEYVSCNSGFPWIADFEGVRRKALLKDYVVFVKLVHQTSLFKINGGVMVTPADIPYDPFYPVMLYVALTHSDKCLFGGIGGEREPEMVMDMLKIVFGNQEELIEKPRIATIVSPLSPLQFDKTMLDMQFVYTAYGQPVIIAPAVMAGSTGPVTLAGTIALANAETLAGIALSQMMREGTPVIYGSASSGTDMRAASFAIGSPESALCAAFCGRLAKFYDLPCRGGGTLNDAKSVSVQAGYESMMVMFVAAQERINFILHCAGALDSYGSMSFEKYITDLEILSMVDYYLQGLKTDQQSLALEVINQVGPGGEFLTHQSTGELCRSALWSPEISLRGAATSKHPDEALKEKIAKKKQRMLNSYSQPSLSSRISLDLGRYLTGSGIDLSIVNSGL